MIALWIILGLLALILVLMLIPAGLALHYHGEDFTAEGKWLFLRFTLWPLPEKEEPEKQKKSRKKAAEKPKRGGEIERRPFMDWLQLIDDLLPVLGEALRKMGKSHHAEAVPDYHGDRRRGSGSRTRHPVWAGQRPAVYHLRISRPPHPCKGIQSGSPAGLSFRAGGRERQADLLVLVCPMILAGAGFRLLRKRRKKFICGFAK